MGTKTVAVDFDGVLHPYTRGWTGPVPDDEDPMPGAEEFLAQLKADGYEIVVFSTRCSEQDGLEGTTNWLRQTNLMQYITRVTCEKPIAVAYVDDRAVPYKGDFKDCLVGVYGLTRGRQSGEATGG